MAPTNLRDLTPAYLIHPGEILNDELKARAITQAEFAKMLSMERSQLNEYIKGKRDFTTELCLLIGAALNMNEAIWLNLQQNYEVNKLKIDKRTKAKLAEVQELKHVNDLPKKYLKDHGVIKDTNTESISELRALYGVPHLSEISQMVEEPRYAYHRSSQKPEVSLPNLITWERMVRQRAKTVRVGDFDENSAETLTAALKAVFHENDQALEKCAKLLADHGIKLIHLPRPDKCAVDGFSFWSEGKPAIGLSLRYNRIDHLAHTLMHELGHVFLHLPHNAEASYLHVEDEQGSFGKEEKEATAFAQNRLIDPKAWDAFNSKYSKVSDQHFIAFAEENGIHPAIAFGRYCHDKKHFKKRTKIDRVLR